MMELVVAAEDPVTAGAMFAFAVAAVADPDDALEDPGEERAAVEASFATMEKPLEAQFGS